MSVPTPRNLVTPTDTGAMRAAGDAPKAASTIVTRETELASRVSRIGVAVASCCGTHHGTNEDAHSALDSAAPLFVVADGVGGGALAARVSRELVARLHGQLDGAQPTPENVREALLDADQEITRTLAAHTDASGAATVALCMGIDAPLAHWLVAWVGDCRVYRVSGDDGEPAQLLTIDDTYANLNEAVPAGGAPEDPARMVGNGAVDAPNVRETHVGDRDLLVLCSDGVHKHVAAQEIAHVLRHRASLARNCARLIELARMRGSHDDATVLAVRRRTRSLATVTRMLAIATIAAAMTGALAWITGVNSGIDTVSSQQVLLQPTSPSGAQP